MLNGNQASGLNRDEVRQLVEELQRVDRELRCLGDGLRQLLDEPDE